MSTYSIKIGNKEISQNSPAYIIAEIGNNHNGSMERALKLIDMAVEMGADCAKFQMRELSSVYRSKTLKREEEDLSTEYTLDLLDKFELTKEQHKELKDYCDQKGIDYLCTPWDEKSADYLASIGVKAFKIASADMTNLPLIEYLASKKLPIIISTGMSTEEEIQKTIEYTRDSVKAEFAVLHCNSTYPAPLQNINLNYLKTLAQLHPLVGYSGHERGTSVTLAAVGLGAKIVERHFTLDRLMEGPDHAASLEYDDFRSMIKGIREIEKALGSTRRFLSQGEMINRENLAKSIIAAKDLPEGTVLTREDMLIRSPGQGLSPQMINELVGKTLKRDIKVEDFFFKSDIDDKTYVPSNYEFKRPWGVPVRYHDFNFYNDVIKPDIFEFHLSYQDMNLNLEDYFSGTYDVGFVVHAPELFEGSRLMDLATDDEEYRQFSLKETQRVIDITRSLKKYFPNTKRPAIVANIGGFTMDGVLDQDTKNKYYEIFVRSLSELDLEGVELIPQTMAPFPWHFGGQRYQNLFVHADETLEFCKKHNLRICFDVSHSMLTCNHFKYDFYEFVEKLAPITAHLHLGDAKGVDGEGLQVGDGDIDFQRMSEILYKGCPKASFIPEIWQGHKNKGEGFWKALEKLQGVFV